MATRFALVTLLLAVPGTALAHPGNHGGMSVSEVIRHYAEPDHLAFLALTVIVGVLAFRWGRRIEARNRVTVREDRRPQP